MRRQLDDRVNEFLRRIAGDASAESGLIADAGLARIPTGNAAPPPGTIALIRAQRPTFRVRAGRIALPTPPVGEPDPLGPWTALRSPPVVAAIERAARAVVAVRGEGAFGSAFRVGPDLFLTNRHVAAAYASGVGRACRLLQPMWLDPGGEGGEEDRSNWIPVQEIVWIHPRWDVALLRVAAAPDEMPILALGVGPPAGPGRRRVVVIGHPAGSPPAWSATPAVQALWAEAFGAEPLAVKRVQPGEVQDEGAVLVHDCATLGGNSGSPILDLETGEVLGIHVGGMPLELNFGLPGRLLATDDGIDGIFAADAARPPRRRLAHWDAPDTPPSRACPAPVSNPLPAGSMASRPAPRDPSGPHWAARYPIGRSLATLDPALAERVVPFLEALGGAGATVGVRLGWVPPERAWLRQAAERAAHGGDPGDPHGIGIEWRHGSEGASREAALALVVALGATPRPGSEHCRGRAVDLEITQGPEQAALEALAAAHGLERIGGHWRARAG